MRLSSAILLLVAILAGCNNPDSLTSKLVDKTKKLVSVLKTVKDKDSALAAKSRIESIGNEMDQLLKSAETMVGASKAQADDAIEKYKPELDQVRKDIDAEMERILKIPQAGEIVKDAMMKLAKPEE